MNPSPIDVIRREGHCQHSLPHLDNYIIFQNAYRLNSARYKM